MEFIEQNVSAKLQSEYEFAQRDHAELLSMLESWHSHSIEQQQVRMARLISGMKPAKKGKSDRGSYKTSEILSLLPKGMQPKSILDVGTGDGEIVTALAKKFQLRADKVWALTVTPLPKSQFYTLITYDTEGKISALADGSIDLITITQVLHHIHPEDRKRTLREIRRVLRPQGVVVIQEHNYIGDWNTYLALDVLHTFWYVKKNETVDGLYMMSKQQTAALFSRIGMREEKSTEARGWQWMYWASYAPGKSREELTREEYWKSTLYSDLVLLQNSVPSTLQEWDPILFYLTALNKRTPYHTRYASRQSNNSVGWGQLKLFLSIIQGLVQYWDPVLVPKLIVVYAGAAPGRSFTLLHELFPTVVWHLYDSRELDIPTIPGKIVFHKQYFTDITASEWSQQDNVFFFSDIRRKGKEQHDVEESIIEDMRAQSDWVKIMNPYRASLKLRAPYILEDQLTHKVYLEGNVMLQSFNRHNSAEARLMPMRSTETGLYYDKDWDWKTYEDILFYHNAVVREKVLFWYDRSEDGLVEENSLGLDNHFESVHLLSVLDEYEQKFGEGTGAPAQTSVALARDVMVALSKYSNKGEITLARLRREQAASTDEGDEEDE